MSAWPFNANLPKNRSTEIYADGFPGSALGCVYDGRRLEIARRLYEAVARTSRRPGK